MGPFEFAALVRLANASRVPPMTDLEIERVRTFAHATGDRDLLWTCLAALDDSPRVREGGRRILAKRWNNLLALTR